MYVIIISMVLFLFLLMSYVLLNRFLIETTPRASILGIEIIVVEGFGSLYRGLKLYVYDFDGYDSICISYLTWCPMKGGF